MQSLTLFIPGLFSPARNLSADALPSTPALDKILTCGEHQRLVPHHFCDALARLFNHEYRKDSDFPIAAITHMLDDQSDPDGIWMRADPVHLAADQQGLILMDDSSFTLDQHDALVLAADVSTIFAERGMQLEAPTTNRWYVRLRTPPAIRTTPVHEVTGRDINPFMPTGPDKALWAGIMNEVQMVFHNSEINVNRQNENENPVNSLWFWGGGQRPVATACPWSRVFTDEAICHGLAKLSEIPVAELPEKPDDIFNQCGEQDNVLVVISFGLRHSQYRDINGWQDFIAYLDQDLFANILKNIRSGHIKSLNLLTEHRKIHLNKNAFYRFWRRTRPVSAYAG